MTNKYYNSLQQFWVSSDKDDGTENETFETEIKGKNILSMYMHRVNIKVNS